MSCGSEWHLGLTTFVWEAWYFPFVCGYPDRVFRFGVQGLWLVFLMEPRYQDAVNMTHVMPIRQNRCLDFIPNDRFKRSGVYDLADLCCEKSPHETQKHSKEWKIFPSTKSYKSPSHSQGVILEQQTMLNEYRRTDISCTHSKPLVSFPIGITLFAL